MTKIQFSDTAENRNIRLEQGIHTYIHNNVVIIPIYFETEYVY